MTVITNGDLYVKAMSATSAYLDAVRSDHWQHATPCSEWTVRDIANHLIGENLWAAELFNGMRVAEVGNRLDGDITGMIPPPPTVPPCAPPRLPAQLRAP